MSFKIPSHKNSTNAQRARRGNWKSDVRKNKNIIAELTEMAKRNEVTKTEKGYAVKTFISVYEITSSDNGLHCPCSDKRDLGICSHIIAAEMFAAAREIEKQAKIAVSRKIIADSRETIAGFEAAADAGKCFWCQDKNIAGAEGDFVPCGFCDHQPDEDFHYQAGEIEMHYDNSNYWEAA